MDKQFKVQINLVTYNGEKYLPFCLESVFKQTFKDFKLLIIDNDSSDESVKFIKEKYPQVDLVVNQKNKGFAAAHNQGIAWSRSDYVLLLNQDMVLAEDYLEKIVEFLDNNPKVGAAAGKIYSWDFEKNIKTQKIDSLGLKIFKNHKVADINQGKVDDGSWREPEEVFGVSGSAPVYRKEN